MTNKFDTLNDEFNVEGDIVQPEVVDKKIEKIKEATADICRAPAGALQISLSWHKKVRCQEHMKLQDN